MSQNRPDDSVFSHKEKKPDVEEREATQAVEVTQGEAEQRQESAVDMVYDGAAKKDGRTFAPDTFDEEEDEEKTHTVHRTGCKAFLYKFQRCFEYMIPPGGYVASAFTLGSATLGTGILGLPSAFNSMGLAMSIIILVIIVIFTIFALYLMARAADVTGLRTYPDIAQAILGYWPSMVISLFLVVFCLGTDVSYVISIGNLFTPT